MFRFWKGRNWMVQLTSWAGPFNFGIHISVLPSQYHYVDFHLPYLVITIGNVNEVEYPGTWHCASKDIHTGVKYGGKSDF